MPSGVLFHRRHDDHAVAMLELDRGEDGAVVLGDLRAGRVGLELIKVTGSAFAAFARDDYTTLPERRTGCCSRSLDISWRYADPASRSSRTPARYVDSTAGAPTSPPSCSTSS